MPCMSDAEMAKQREIREIVRAEREQQRQEQKRQEQAEKRQSAKAARRAKYKQTPNDSFLVFAIKEFLR